MIELWKKFLEVKQYTTTPIENQEQQQFIHAFKINETGDIISDIDSINNTLLKLYLLDDENQSFIYYRTYLMSCKKQQDSYGFKYVPDIDKTKLEFHKFNVWIDEFYKKNKLNIHRLQDEEKYFYLYLLKEANDICQCFPKYFHDEID